MSEQTTRTPDGEQDYAGTPRPDAMLPALDEGQLEALRQVGREWDQTSAEPRVWRQALPVDPGLTFVLSGGAAILVRYGGFGVQPWEPVLVLSAVSALWLVVAVYFLGDISAHFNPATTLAFALRRDMDWVMAGAYWVVQFAAAVCGALLARGFFGPAGHLAATMPKPGQSWQAAGFEVIITFGLVLMILNMANGPKLNGPFIPLAVGAYIMAWGTMGGPYEGASMNPARSFGPDVAIGNLSTWWVYLIGPAAGAVIAVGVAYVLRGPAKAQEAMAAEGTPLDRVTT
jgi:glycerol uptake facilitator-like aquaporin